MFGLLPKEYMFTVTNNGNEIGQKKKVKLVAKPAHPSLIAILGWKPAAWHASEGGRQGEQSDWASERGGEQAAGVRFS